MRKIPDSIPVFAIRGLFLAHPKSTKRHDHKQPSSANLSGHKVLYIQDIHTTYNSSIVAAIDTPILNDADWSIQILS